MDATNIHIAVLEKSCECLHQSRTKYRDRRFGQHLVTFTSAQFSHGDKKWTWNRGDMQLPEATKCMRKLLQRELCPTTHEKIRTQLFELWLATAPSNTEQPNQIQMSLQY